MANKPEVRAILREKGIHIPESTIFVGGLRDTTRDDVVFYDEEITYADYKIKHAEHVKLFAKALDQNAKERSRRFESIDTSAKQARYMKRSEHVQYPFLNHVRN
jgi:uncharacterized protein YbcC (UPF0753/DUF2309 family)